MIVTPEVLFRYYMIAENATESSLEAHDETEPYAYCFGMLCELTQREDIARSWLLGAMLRAAAPEHAEHLLQPGACNQPAA